MLLNMRKMTRGWIAGGILGILVIAFATWGVNDAFRGIGNANVADVAGEKVTPSELTRLLDRWLEAQREQGNQVTRVQAVEAGLHMRLLEQLIGQKAMKVYARDIGVSASDIQVAEAVRSMPFAQNPITGQFDTAAIDQFLQRVGYTRREFEEGVRGDLTNDMIAQAFTAGLRAPTSYGLLMLAYQSERRTLTLAEAPASLVGAINPPTEEEINAFYTESAESLQVPEFRAVTLVYAHPEDFIARVEVPEETVAAEFESRRAGLTQPETRTVVQISAPDQAQAQDAAARLGRGEEADAVASALGLQVVRYEQSEQSAIADAAVRQAAFSMAEGAAQAVQGRLTPWAAVRVLEIIPGVTPRLEDVAAELRAELALHEAAELQSDAMEAFDDARSGGATVTDAARTANLRTLVIPAVSADGADPNGLPVEALAGQTVLLEAAFDTLEGESTEFTPDGENSYTLIGVDRVTAQSTRPLEEVRAELIAAWVTRERGRRLRTLSEDVVEAVNGGQSFTEVARARGLTIRERSRVFDREQASQIPARNLAGLAYSAREGQLVSDIRVDGQAVIFALVEAIERTDPATAPDQVELGRMQMQQSLSQSLNEAIGGEAIARAKPRRNEELVNRLFATGAARDEDQMLP